MTSSLGLTLGGIDLPSFLWLWRVAAWSMGFTVLAYLILAVSGGWLRRSPTRRPGWVRSLHLTTGIAMLSLILLLLGIGIVGTLGHFGSLGHSSHLAAGLGVVSLAFASAWSAMQIQRRQVWARSLHLAINLVLGSGLVWASLTGWTVVQKYLP
jgi:hypothetical protein